MIQSALATNKLELALLDPFGGEVIWRVPQETRRALTKIINE